MKRNSALKLVLDEVDRACAEFDAMSSCHEGYAVIKEELDELWDEVKAGNGNSHRGASEAVQVAAMGLRYLLDLCDEATAEQHVEKVREHDHDMRGRSYGGGGYSG